MSTASVNQAALDAVLAEQIRSLKLSTMGRELESVARQARDGGWPYEEFLRELLDRELSQREQRAAARRLREAKFPDVKTLDQINWSALEGVSRPKILELATSVVNTGFVFDRMIGQNLTPRLPS